MNFWKWVGGAIACASLAFAAPLSANARSDALDVAVKADKFGAVTSILVLRDGQPIFEEYYRDTNAETLRNTRSVTKTITAALLGKAIEDGAIASLDVPVLQFFPDSQVANADPRKSAMTLRNLVTMTGPLECDDWNSFSRGNEERMYLVEDWAQFFLDLPIGAAPPWEPAAKDRPFGKRFSYCTAGVFTLGRIVEIATGRELEDYARETLFDPIGIGEVRWAFNRLGQAQGGGGLEMAARDLARFGELYRKSGAKDAKQVLAQEFVAASTEPRARVRDGLDYGYLWWLGEVGPADARSRAWMMNGTGGNRVAVLPDLDATVIITTTNFRRGDAHQLTDAILSDHVVPMLQDGAD
ncbi:MAG: serine hydrolase [Pseudomonadota bacterium]